MKRRLVQSPKYRREVKLLARKLYICSEYQRKGYLA